MPIDRRTLVLAAASIMATRHLQAKSIEDQGLFWSVTPPGEPASILFGYARVAAMAAPSVVADGQKFTLQSGMLLADVPNVRFPPVSIDRNALKPIVDRVPPALAQRIRAFLGEHFANLPGADRVTGLELTILLQGEGQAPPEPSVGGTIAQAAPKGGRPLAYLMSQQDYVAAYHPPDLAALDQHISADVIDYLFALRDRVGPIGKQQESLYAGRHVGELSRLTDELKQHGVPSFADLGGFAADHLKAMIVERAVKAVQTTAGPLFLLVPVTTLTDDDGVLAKATATGIAVKLLA